MRDLDRFSSRIDEVDGYRVIEAQPNRLVIDTPVAPVTVERFDKQRMGIAAPLILDLPAGTPGREEYLATVLAENLQHHGNSIALNEQRTHLVLKRDFNWPTEDPSENHEAAAIVHLGQLVADVPVARTRLLQIAQDQGYHRA